MFQCKFHLKIGLHVTKQKVRKSTSKRTFLMQSYSLSSSAWVSVCYILDAINLNQVVSGRVFPGNWKLCGQGTAKPKRTILSWIFLVKAARSMSTRQGFPAKHSPKWGLFRCGFRIPKPGPSMVVLATSNFFGLEHLDYKSKFQFVSTPNLPLIQSVLRQLFWKTSWASPW